MHPNQLGLRVFQLVACRYYINRNDNKVSDLIINFIAIIFVYLVPNSQTAYICLAILFLFVLIQRVYHYLSKGKDFNFLGVYFVIATVLIVMSVFFSTWAIRRWEFVRKLDKLVSIRFSACNRCMDIYGISVFGQKVFISTDELSKAGLASIGRLYLDNAYMAMLIRCGIIVFLLWLRTC